MTSFVKKVLYLTGPGNIIAAHNYWRKNKEFPEQFSKTFSGQIESFCKENNLQLYAISQNNEANIICDGRFKLQHLPKRLNIRAGLGFHISELLQVVRLLSKAIKYKPQILIIDNFNSYQFVFYILNKLFNTRVISILHCTLWPKGNKPRNRTQKILLKFNSLFYKNIVDTTLAVSPECERQVYALTKKRNLSVRQIRAQYNIKHFIASSHKPRHDDVFFNIIFVGRIVKHKGVFDIILIAKQLLSNGLDKVRWHICGDGPDFQKLLAQIKACRLENIITLYGWTSPSKQLELYKKMHASIVPTKSSFAEGLAMVAVESVLCHRPVITSNVVPAAEVLEEAVILAETDSIDSYVEKITSLVLDEEYYMKKVFGCENNAKQFVDKRFGLTKVLSDCVQ